jgi:hypothetical protein
MASIQGARTAQAAVLTAVMMVFLAGIGFTVGKEALVLCSLTMPVALLLLWLSADVTRADERQPAMARARRPPDSATDIGVAHPSLHH